LKNPKSQKKISTNEGGGAVWWSRLCGGREGFVTLL